MRVKPNYIAPLVAAGAIAAAIVATPITAAASTQAAAGTGAAATPSNPAPPQQSCVTLGVTQNQCQSPGNAQVYDAPPQVDYFPYAGGGT